MSIIYRSSSLSSNVDDDSLVEQCQGNMQCNNIQLRWVRISLSKITPHKHADDEVEEGMGSNLIGAQSSDRQQSPGQDLKDHPQTLWAAAMRDALEARIHDDDQGLQKALVLGQHPYRAVACQQIQQLDKVDQSSALHVEIWQVRAGTVHIQSLTLLQQSKATIASQAGCSIWPAESPKMARIAETRCLSARCAAEVE